MGGSTRRPAWLGGVGGGGVLSRCTNCAVGSRELFADDLVVAIPISSHFLRVPVEALARLGTVRLVAPHAMESRVIAANFALQELVRRLVEVHIAFKATAARFEAEQQPAGG